MEDPDSTSVPKEEILPVLVKEIKSLKSSKSSIRGKLEEVLAIERGELRCDNAIEPKLLPEDFENKQEEPDDVVESAESEQLEEGEIPETHSQRETHYETPMAEEEKKVPKPYP